MWTDGEIEFGIYHEWEIISTFLKSEHVKYEIKLHKHSEGDKDKLYGIVTTRSDGERTFILDGGLYFPTEESAREFVTTRKEQIATEPELPHVIVITYPDMLNKRGKRGSLNSYFFFESNHIKWKERNAGLEFTEIVVPLPLTVLKGKSHRQAGSVHKR